MDLCPLEALDLEADSGGPDPNPNLSRERAGPVGPGTNSTCAVSVPRSTGKEEEGICLSVNGRYLYCVFTVKLTLPFSKVVNLG